MFFLDGSSLASDSSITDGKYTIPYTWLYRHIADVECELQLRKIAPEHGVALICSQTVATALVLLGLFERKQCVMLLGGESTSSILPIFFRYRVEAEAVGIPPHLEGVRIKIEESPNWSGRTLGLDMQKIFVRTSGSTGDAKLVMHDCACLLENARNVGRRLGVLTSDRICLPVPFRHLYGLGAAFLPAVLQGASVDLQSGTNVMKYLERERTFNPSIAYITPTFALALATARRKSRLYRMTVMAGDRVPRETFERYSERSGCVVQVYGSTEMGAMAATNPSDSAEVRATTGGLPLPGVEFDIEKETGQLLCRHKYGFESYASETGEVLTRAEWYPTRDLVEFDGIGRIKVLGRCDHLVKRDGVWISITDVEAALLRIPDISSAAVVAISESARGKALVAYCVLRDASRQSESAIREACFDLLTRRAVPDIIQIVSILPYLDTGKVDRQSLIDRANVALHSGMLRFVRTSAGEKSLSDT